MHAPTHAVSRRRFLVGSGALLATGVAGRGEEPALERSAETLAQALHATLSPAQRDVICFPWDHVDPKLGLLRTRVGNNWNVTKPELVSDFYSPEQRGMVRAIFEQLIRPEWQERIDKQLEDDAGVTRARTACTSIGTPPISRSALGAPGPSRSPRPAAGTTAAVRLTGRPRGRCSWPAWRTPGGRWPW